MRAGLKLLALTILFFTSSLILLSLINVELNPLGSTIVRTWCEVRADVGSHNPTECLTYFNSGRIVLEEAISLSLFLFVIAGTVLRMEWRVGLAGLSVVLLVLSNIVPPSELVGSAVSWDLILFLVGSMTFAGILRELGVFEYLAIQVLRLGRSGFSLITLICLLSFVTAAVLGEVTSILYVMMVVLEVGTILKTDVVPLIVLSVLATNTGSAALPIGNPIGVYIFFSAKLDMSSFMRYALPLAVANLIALLATSYLLLRPYIKTLDRLLKTFNSNIEAYLTTYYVSIDYRRERALSFGLITLLTFILSVSLNDYIATSLTHIFGIPVDPHSLLAFIPYIFVTSAFIIIPLEELNKYLERSVDWPSLLFFIFLFMLAYSLSYTGVMARLAYILSTIGGTALMLLPIVLVTSAALSSVLDNLSLVVAFTPLAMTLYDLGIVSKVVFFALLFGGVFGGNFTPVGSTANIVAISIAEKRKVRVAWHTWFRIASILTGVQLLISLMWVLFSM
ncbi:MAG: SLC13 family permease [Sulfolobales archaeon]